MKGNEQSLALIQSKLESFSKHQKVDFSESIEALKRKAAAAGSLGSGGTIKNTCLLLEQYLSHRAEYFLSTLQDMPVTFHKGLAPAIDAIVEKYLPIDFRDFRDTVLNTIHLAAGNNQRASSAGLELAEVANGKVIERTRREMKQFLHNLAGAAELSAKNKWCLGIEGALLLATAFLAGCWVTDPSGNYEPWTILAGCIVASTEVYRRISSKNA